MMAEQPGDASEDYEDYEEFIGAKKRRVQRLGLATAAGR
jgi:hypothetical protein